VVKSSKDDNSEKAAAGIDNEKNVEEYLLGTLDCSDVINDQDLWIADATATVLMTPCRNGLDNIKKSQQQRSNNNGNGTKEPITEIADVIGTISVKNEVKKG
jgi:hypothetical protein